MITRTSTLLPFALLICAGAATAAPNFSGDWNLNPARSKYGQFPAPAALTRKIRHADPVLNMSTTQKGAQGEVTTELKYTTDGKPSVNKLATGDTQGVAHWDGDRLVIESARAVQGGQAKQKETWTLSDGGKTLTILTHIIVPQGEFDVTQVLEKQ
jgi:hypothetical protein